MQVVRTKLFDIIADPKMNIRHGEGFDICRQMRRLESGLEKFWRGCVSLWKDKARQTNILSLIRLLGRDLRMPEAFDQISGTNADNSWKSWWRFKSEGLADKGLVVAFMDKLPTGFSRQDTHSSPKRAPLPFRALPVCLCVLYNLCSDCGHFSQTYFYTVMFKSQQTLYVFKVDMSSQKLLRHETVDLDSSPMELEKFVLDVNILWMAFIWMQGVQFSHKWYVHT